MSRKANPTVIGSFVVGAVAIAVAAVLILTGGQLFKKKLPVVMYFDGSVKGLSVGAPVNLRGVQIGTVKEIEIVVSPDQDVRIPVTVDIDPSAFTMIGYGSRLGIDEFRQGIYESCRDDGLRAQLQMQSLLTGQLFIQLDYFPETVAHFIEASDVTEIPTIPTTLQELGSVLEDFPIKAVLGNLEKTIAALAELSGDEGISQAITSINQAAADVSLLVGTLDKRTQTLQPVLVEAQHTLTQATTTLAAAEKTFEDASATLVPVKDLVADDSELLEAIDDTLAAMTEAAQAVTALAETLERRPEAMIKGKGVFGGE